MVAADGVVRCAADSGLPVAQDFPFQREVQGVGGGPVACCEGGERVGCGLQAGRQCVKAAGLAAQEVVQAGAVGTGWLPGPVALVGSVECFGDGIGVQGDRHGAGSAFLVRWRGLQGGMWIGRVWWRLERSFPCCPVGCLCGRGVLR